MKQCDLDENESCYLYIKAECYKLQLMVIQIVYNLCQKQN